MSEPHHFSLRFHRFYCETLKRILKQVPGIKFNMECRAWQNDLRMYTNTVQYIEKHCKEINVHIEEIPKEMLALMQHKTPTANHGQMWNYSED
jgi:hypothetical protein